MSHHENDEQEMFVLSFEIQDHWYDIHHLNGVLVSSLFSVCPTYDEVHCVLEQPFPKHNIIDNLTGIMFRSPVFQPCEIGTIGMNYKMFNSD